MHITVVKIISVYVDSGQGAFRLNSVWNKMVRALV